MIVLIYPALSSQIKCIKCNFHVHYLISKCLNIEADDMVDFYFPPWVPLDKVRSRWLDIGLVPFCVFIIGLPVAKHDKVLSRSKKDN